MATCCARATGARASIASKERSLTLGLEPTCNTILQGNGLLEQRFRDRLQLHVARPLIDRADLRVAVELLDRVLPAVAISSKKLYANRADLVCHLAAEELGHGGFLGERLARVLEPRRVVYHKTSGGELCGSLGDLELDSLELSERLAELFPLLDVAERGLEGASRDTDHLGTDPDSTLVEGLDRDLVPLADRADHVLFGHL